MSKRLEVIEQALARGSTDPFVWYARAMELRSLGRRDDALEAYAAVRSRFPAYVPTYLMGGQLAAEAGRGADARTWYEEGVRVASAAGDSHAVSELRSALALLGD